MHKKLDKYRYEENMIKLSLEQGTSFYHICKEHEEHIRKASSYYLKKKQENIKVHHALVLVLLLM